MARSIDRNRKYGILENDIPRTKRQDRKPKDMNWSEYLQPCKHDECPHCKGTTIKEDGTDCIHHFNCTCQKCDPD